MLKELYSQYGEIMIQLEVLQAKLNNIKSAIFAELQPKATEQAPEQAAGCCPETNGCPPEETK